MKLMIVDDNVIIRDGLLMTLQNAYLIDTYKFAPEIYKSIKIAETFPADLVLLNLLMPEGLDGVCSLKQLRKLLPEAKIVVFSTHDEIHFQKKAFECGADGFLLSYLTKNEFFQSLDQILANKKVFCNHVLDQNMDTDRLKLYDLPLTEREQEVFTLTVRGFSQKDIAEKLNISTKTVENFRHKIGEKLDTQNRYEWVEISLKYNILSEHLHL